LFFSLGFIAADVKKKDVDLTMWVVNVIRGCEDDSLVERVGFFLWGSLWRMLKRKT
jgi:hypothetical protein